MIFIQALIFLALTVTAEELSLDQLTKEGNLPLGTTLPARYFMWLAGSFKLKTKSGKQIRVRFAGSTHTGISDPAHADQEFDIQRSGVLRDDFDCELLAEQVSSDPDMEHRLAKFAVDSRWIQNHFPENGADVVRAADAFSRDGKETGELNRMKDEFVRRHRAVINFDLVANENALSALAKKQGVDAAFSEVYRAINFMILKIVPIKSLKDLDRILALRADFGPLGESLLRKKGFGFKAGAFTDFVKRVEVGKAQILDHRDDQRAEYMSDVLAERRTTTCIMANSVHILDILNRLKGRITEFHVDNLALDPDGARHEQDKHLPFDLKTAPEVSR